MRLCFQRAAVIFAAFCVAACSAFDPRPAATGSPGAHASDGPVAEAAARAEETQVTAAPNRRATTLLAGGDERGNGGGVVLCRNADGSIALIESIDRYEARGNGIEPDLGNDAMTISERAAIAFGRLARLDDVRAKRYAASAARLVDSGRFMPGITIPWLSDGDVIPIPVGCVLETVVARQTPLDAADPEFIVNKDLWDALTPLDQAILLVHEGIYEEAFLDFEHGNARSTRRFCAALFSHALDQASPKYYAKMLIRLSLPKLDLAGFVVELNGDVRFDLDENIVKVRTWTKKWRFGDRDLRMHSRSTVNSGFVYFYPSKAIRAVDFLYSEEAIAFQGNQWSHLGPSGGSAAPISPICLYESGGIRAALTERGTIKMRDGTTFTGRGWFELDEEGFFVRNIPNPNGSTIAAGCYPETAQP